MIKPRKNGTHPIKELTCEELVSRHQHTLEADGQVPLTQEQDFVSFKHHYSHFTADIRSKVYLVRETGGWPESEKQKWISPEAHEKYGFSASDRKLLQAWCEAQNDELP